jgi:hypothetical protein
MKSTNACEAQLLLFATEVKGLPSPKNSQVLST